MSTETEITEAEKIPSVDPKKSGKKRGPYKPREAKTDGEAKPSTPKKPKAARMPLPQGLLSIGADIPYFIAGTAYQRTKFSGGRPLIIPGAGEMEAPKAMGPAQIKEVYKAGQEAWAEMTKAWDIQLPPWAVWLGSCAIVTGASILLDQMNAMAEAIAKMTPEQRAKVEAEMKRRGVPVPDAFATKEPIMKVVPNIPPETVATNGVPHGDVPMYSEGAEVPPPVVSE